MINPHPAPFGDPAGWDAIARHSREASERDASRRYPRPVALAAGIATALSLLLFGATLLDRHFGDPLDHTDPDAVAVAFLQRHAAGSGMACELVTDAARPRFLRDGVCSSRQPDSSADMRDTGGDADANRWTPHDITENPAVSVLSSTTCGDQHSTAAQVDPPGRLAAPYAVVSLEQHGRRWRVTRMLRVDDRAVLTPYECESR